MNKFKAQGKPNRKELVKFIDADSSEICPVPGCHTQKGNIELFKQHWKQIHMPHLLAYLCSECFYVHSDMDKLVEHYKNNHRYKTGEALNIAIQETMQCHMTKKGWIDPTPYKLGLVSVDEITPDFIISTKIPPNITCPVPSCNKKTFSSEGCFVLFRQHWQQFHLPLSRYFGCNMCEFKSASRVSLSNHGKKTHGCTPVAAWTQVKAAAVWEQRNEHFSDPGKNRLTWRRMVPLNVD